MCRLYDFTFPNASLLHFAATLANASRKLTGSSTYLMVWLRCILPMLCYQSTLSPVDLHILLFYRQLSVTILPDPTTLLLAFITLIPLFHHNFSSTTIPPLPQLLSTAPQSLHHPAAHRTSQWVFLSKFGFRPKIMSHHACLCARHQTTHL